MISSKKKLMMSYKMLSLLFVSSFTPNMTIAQYNPHKQSTEYTTVIVQYVIEMIEIILAFVVVFAVFRLIIAGILFITSGGDEERMDTSIMWAKYSTLGIVLSTIIYTGINVIK